MRVRAARARAAAAGRIAPERCIGLPHVLGEVRVARAQALTDELGLRFQGYSMAQLRHELGPCCRSISAALLPLVVVRRTYKVQREFGIVGSALNLDIGLQVSRA